MGMKEIIHHWISIPESTNTYTYTLDITRFCAASRPPNFKKPSLPYTSYRQG